MGYIVSRFSLHIIKFCLQIQAQLNQIYCHLFQVFQPLHEENDEGLLNCIRQQNPSQFIARLFLKRPSLSGTFEVKNIIHLIRLFYVG